MTGGSSGEHGESERLLLDAMLGKLAVYLRICGYDAAYVLDRDIEDDDRIAELAEAEDRLLLTRDVELADQVDDALCLTTKDVREQLAELDRAGFDLDIAEEPTRCGRCNGLLDPVPEDTETPDYAPDPATTDCWQCRSCGRIFWRGSHYERMKNLLDGLD